MKDISFLNEILNSDKIGLKDGKMRVVIFLFLMARFNNKNKKRFSERAFSLLEDIQKNISVNTTFDYANGIAGIGTALIFLVQEEFLEGDVNEILSEFDDFLFKKIYFTNYDDLSLENGLMGLGYYFIHRVKNMNKKQENFTKLSFDHLLIVIQDILLGNFNINGYTYPVQKVKKITSKDLLHIKIFLKHIINLNLCNVLSYRLLNKISTLEVNPNVVVTDNELISLINLADIDNDHTKKNKLLRIIANNESETIEKNLANMSLNDNTLPHWWAIL